MYHRLTIAWLANALCLCGPLIAQQNGRFADLKAKAFDAFEKNHFAEVAGTLEQVWEEDQTDPKVAEYLAMGYLYGEHDMAKYDERNLAKARPLMDKAIALGGQATFLVIHSHQRMGFLQDDLITDFCSGRLSIIPGKLTFVPDSGEDGATILTKDLRDFSIPKDGQGRIHVKAGGKSFTFRVKTRTRGEALLLGQIAEQNLKR
jgi:hypothetical protein